MAPFQMPLYTLSKQRDFDQVVFERRLNALAFTVCWSLGSKMILPSIYDLSHEPNLTHVNFHRIDVDEMELDLAQRLNIVCLLARLTSAFASLLC